MVSFSDVPIYPVAGFREILFYVWGHIIIKVFDFVIYRLLLMNLPPLGNDEIYFSGLMHINDPENPPLFREKYFFTTLVIPKSSP